MPTTSAPDGRTRPPHLRSWRDGWRHLRFLLLFSPRWLFLIPGLVLFTLGVAVTTGIEAAALEGARPSFDLDTLASPGPGRDRLQCVLFAVFTKVFASAEGFLPGDARLQQVLARWGLETGLLVGALLARQAWPAVSSHYWLGFGSATWSRGALRDVIPAVTAFILGCRRSSAASS